jgi:VCBS repeat-containing protein
MPAIGVITLELHIEHSHSLKDKRHVVKSLKERLKHKHNISIAEVDGQDTWQSATLAAVTISGSRDRAEQVLIAVENDAANTVGESLIRVTMDWLE